MANKSPLNITYPEKTADFELFFRVSSDAMLIFSIDGKVVDFNQAYEKITGYSRAELFAMNGGWDLVHPDDAPARQQRLLDAKTKNIEAFNFDVRIIHKDKSIRYITYDSTMDRIKGLVYVIGRDTTEIRNEQMKAEQDEFRLKFFFDNVIDGMCIVTDGKFRMVNKALLKILHYENEEEIINKPYIDFIDPEYRPKVQHVVEKNITDIYTSKAIRKDGSLCNIEIAGKTIFYRNEPMRVTVVRDLDERKKYQDKIQESEERFRAIFQNSSIGIALIDKKGNIVEANNNFLSRLEYGAEEIQKLKMQDIVHPDESTATLQSITQLYAKKIDRSYSERRFIRRDHSVTWSKLTFTMVHLPSDQELVMALCEDIDTQKKSERALVESEEKFRAVYESSPMGILITRSPGIIVDVNPAFCEMMGYAESELINKDVLDIIYPADLQATKKKLQKIYNHESNMYVDEKRYLKKDGHYFWAKAVVSAMNKTPDSILTVAIIENIDRKKKTEKALEIKNRELVQINQELEHFAYVASHDLQEPLRTITSFIQILEKRYSDKLDEDGQQFMGFVVEGAKRMQNLIHDLLEYSRINRFNTGYEKIDLNEIFNTVNRVLKDKIESNEALVLSETLPEIYGSKLQLTQVFQNLIDNAIKFKAKKRKPEIIISVEDRGDKWELIFKDNGIGISPDYYERIFVIFQRLHTLEEYTGTGIGLAICKKIIERHGGEIWVESKEGKGTTFHFTLAKNMMVPVE